MGKNTLGNNFQDPDKDLDFEVLEEIPEVNSVKASDTLQLIVLPFLALLLIAAVPLVLSLSVMQKEKTVLDNNFRYSSIESPILNSAVKEILAKRQEVSLKDIQIREYQQRVLDMDDRLRILQGVMEETLQIKKTNLLNEISNILSEERSRLEKLGQSEEEINHSLDQLRNSLESQYNNRIEDFQDQEMAAYQERISALQKEKAALEEHLNNAVRERKNLAEALNTEEAELQNQLYNDEKITSIINEGIDKDIEILRETRNAENYWLDELANQYLGLLNAITSRDYNAAKDHLNALENLFSDETISRLPGIKARNEADRELLRFFNAYLASLEKDDLSALIAESKLLVEQAESHMEAGRYQEADILWQKLGTNWPLMDRANHGFLETHSRLIAMEVKRYARLSESSLASGDYEKAVSNWISGLEQVPEPVGTILKDFWLLWVKNTEKRLSDKDQTALEALAIEKEESAARYEVLNQESGNKLQQLTNQLNEARQLNAEAEERAALSTETAAEQEARIAALEKRISDLEARLKDQNSTESRNTGTGIDKPPAAAEEKVIPEFRWQLYGAIIRIRRETYIVKPIIGEIPLTHTEVRVMQSLGDDRIIHMADGYIISASGAEATIRLTSVFNTPKIGDLVYISSTGNSEEQPSFRTDTAD